MKEPKIIFQERLTDLRAYASDRKNILAKSEIRDFFEGTPLEDSHFNMIFEYLKSQRIQIADTEEEAEEARDSDNPGSLSFYLSDLESAGYLKRLKGENGEESDPEEEMELFRQIIAGSADARERLAELYLPVVCGLADEYEENEIPVEDLIQEGNLGLWMALSEIEETDTLAACQARLLNGINQAMNQAIEESRGHKEKGRAIAEKVNHLNDAVHTLEEELEHKVSVDELSAYLEMPAEEIQDILRMAGDEIDIDGKR
ncbi:MAG: sigma-70 domain-containing protein [Lachnospiraceae bacterium]|nr:sigma-70 domain-containing protein [Lachnospiraceae bacterium]